jgi:gluconolactonase
MIRAFDLLPDGTAQRAHPLQFPRAPLRLHDAVELFPFELEHELAPPGALPAARVWTADALKTKAGVYVISPAGKLLKFIPIPEDVITNNAFGGPDMKTLYVTSGRTVFKIRTEIAGLPR